MATKLLSLGALSQVKAYVDQEAAKAFRSATYTEGTRTIDFFKSTDGTGAAAFSVTLPEDVDISGLIPKVENATANDVAVLNADGTVADSGVLVSALAKSADLATVATSGKAADVTIEDATGKITATTVEGALTEVATSIETLNGSDTTTGSVAKSIKDAIGNLDGTITGSGKFATNLSETDGIVSATMVDLVAADIPTLTLSKISDAGTAAAADIATTAIAESSTDTGLVSAAQVASFVATEIAGLEGAMHFVGVITRNTGETDAQAIARVVPNPESGDVVVMADTAKEYIFVDPDPETAGDEAWREIGDEDLYVHKSTTIAGVDLQDSITKSELLAALNIADGSQVNVLEGVQVNGSDLTIDGDKKVNVTVATGSTNGTIAVNGTDVAVKGLDGAAYKAENYYMVAADYEIATDAEIKAVFGLS